MPELWDLATVGSTNHPTAIYTQVNFSVPNQQWGKRVMASRPPATTPYPVYILPTHPRLGFGGIGVSHVIIRCRPHY